MRVLLIAERERSPRADRHSPLPGGFGAPLVRHDDRSARSSLHWRRGGSSRLHPVIPGNAARSCVRGNSLARTAVERRKASASRWTRGFARSANRWQHLLAWRGPTGQLRLFGALPPFILFGGSNILGVVRKTRMQKRI